MRTFIYEHAVRPRSELVTVGKDAISHHTRWRLPGDHPDAVPDAANTGVTPDSVPLLASPASVQIVVAGANNAGVSAVVEIFGLAPRERPSSYSTIESVNPAGGEL